MLAGPFASAYNGDKIVVVYQPNSNNSKTGNTPSIWIEPYGMSPSGAVKSGCDVGVCGSCPRRSKKSGGLGTCYTHGTEVYLGATRLWERGFVNVDVLKMRDAIKSCTGKPLRMCRHGDSGALTEYVFSKLIPNNHRILGYTHAWKTCQWLRHTHMASVESEDELVEATNLGWRTYRSIRNKAEMHKSEIMCPHYEHKVKCEKCMLCTGSNSGTRHTKNIAVIEH